MLQNIVSLPRSIASVCRVPFPLTDPRPRETRTLTSRVNCVVSKPKKRLDELYLDPVKPRVLRVTRPEVTQHFYLDALTLDFILFVVIQFNKWLHVRAWSCSTRNATAQWFFHKDQFSHLRNTRCSRRSHCWPSLCLAPAHILSCVRAPCRCLAAHRALQGLHVCVQLYLLSRQCADSEFSTLLCRESQRY